MAQWRLPNRQIGVVATARWPNWLFCTLLTLSTLWYMMFSRKKMQNFIPCLTLRNRPLWGAHFSVKTPISVKLDCYASYFHINWRNKLISRNFDLLMNNIRILYLTKGLGKYQILIPCEGQNYFPLRPSRS